MHKKTRELFVLLRKIGFTVSTRLFWIFVIQLMVLTVLFSVTVNISAVRARTQLDNSIYMLNRTLISDTQLKLSELDTSTKFPHLRSYSSAFGQLFLRLIQKKQNLGSITQAFMEESNMMFNQYPKLQTLFLFMPDGNSVSARTTSLADISVAGVPNCYDLPWFQQTLDSVGGVCYFAGKLNSVIGFAGNQNVLFASRAIINSYHGRTPTSLLLCSIDISDVIASFNRQRLYSSQQFSILDSNGQYLLGSAELPVEQLQLQHDESFMLTQGGNTYHINYSEARQIYAVVETPTSQLEGIASLSSSGLYIVLFGIISSTMLIFAFVIRSITGPIRSMVDACDKIGAGDFGVRIEKRSYDEMGYLIDSFNDMLERVDNLISEVYLKDIAERGLELQMLRSQINPHFLYNTLESMRMSAIVQGAPELGEMCRLLAKVLRYGVSQPNEMVTVGEEIDRLNDYIQLQEHRFHDKVHILVHLDSALNDCRIIKLILQPILENALNHGVDIEGGNGVVQIMGYTNNENIEFVISDNGVGMDKDSVDSLMDYLNGRNDSFKSIGLKNIHRRIQLTYGTGYGISITSQKEMGTQVCVCVPIRHS